MHRTLAAKFFALVTGGDKLIAQRLAKGAPSPIGIR
jgi:hypothetical protein